MRAKCEDLTPESSLANESLARRTLTGQTIAFSCYGGGGDCDVGQATAFLNEVTGWMEATSWIHMYFWFGACAGVSKGQARLTTRVQACSPARTAA